MRFLGGHRAPKAAILSVVLATLATFAGACGSESVKTVKAETWVESVCSRFVSFDNATTKIGDGFVDIDMQKPEQAKTELVKLLDEMQKEFDGLQSDFKKLGKPDLQSGDPVRAAFLANFEESGKALGDTAKKVRALNTRSKEFEDDVNRIFEEITEKDFRDRLVAVVDQRRDAKTVIDLIDEDPECAAAIFNPDAGSDAGAEGTPKSGGGATPARAATPVARTTPKANASKSEKWVIGMCTAISSWTAETVALSEGLSLPPNPTPQQAKDAILAYFQNALDMTKKLQKALDALGDPDGKDGKQIQQAFSRMGADLVRSFDDTVKKVKAMETKSLAQVEGDIGQYADEFNVALDTMSATYEQIDRQYDTQEISRIAEDVPECAGVI